MRPAAFLQAPVSLIRQGRVCPAPCIHTKQPPGFSTNPGGFVDKILCGVAYAFLIFSFALAAVSRAASFAAAASSRRRSMAVRVAASVSA